MPKVAKFELPQPQQVIPNCKLLPQLDAYLQLFLKITGSQSLMEHGHEVPNVTLSNE